MSIPREEITEMITDVLGELEPCRHVPRDGTCHECAAVQVMDLFREVWQHHTAGGPCYVLRTAPTKEDPDGPRCPRCGSPRWVSVSLDGGYTRRAQCIPCGAPHAPVIGPWTPPALKKILDQAAKDYNHPSFGFDDLLVMLRDAYDAGTEYVKPHVSIRPPMRSGRPSVNGTRLPVESVAQHVWAGYSVDEVATEYDITRADVLVACWYAGMYGIPHSRGWKKRWGQWADEVHDELWHSRYDVPNPPDERDESAALRKGELTP